MTHLPILLRIISLTLKQSYYCTTVNKLPQRDMGKKHDKTQKVWLVCITCEVLAWYWKSATCTQIELHVFILLLLYYSFTFHWYVICMADVIFSMGISCLYYTTILHDIELSLIIFLNPWGRVTHILVSKLTTIDSDNGLSLGWCQAFILTHAGISLIWPLGTNFSAILIEIYTFLFTKMLSGK